MIMQNSRATSTQLKRLSRKVINRDFHLQIMFIRRSFAVAAARSAKRVIDELPNNVGHISRTFAYAF